MDFGKYGLIGLIIGLAIGFLFGLIGLAVVLLIGLIFYFVSSNKENSKGFLIFAIVGGLIGAICAAIFTISLL